MGKEKARGRGGGVNRNAGVNFSRGLQPQAGHHNETPKEKVNFFILQCMINLSKSNQILIQVKGPMQVRAAVPGIPMHNAARSMFGELALFLPQLILGIHLKERTNARF
jgi:hypothetical protein